MYAGERSSRVAQDLLCRARTGSGKTLCYGVPLIQRLLASDAVVPLSGLILVPTKELIAQVHGVITSLRLVPRSVPKALS